VGHQLVAEAGEQAFERRQAAGLEHVQVPALRRSGSDGGLRRQCVALDDGDAARVPAEGVGDGEPAHAGADDDDVM
jgi:hypothetical protein